MNNKNKAFTIVELIISLLILIIMGIILFVSFLSYLRVTRDLSRITEFKNIESAMYSYILKSGFFPNPNNPVEISYSGSLVWTQGTYTNEISNIIGYSNDVVDPLTKNLYTYSVKNSGTEFSLAGVLEGKKPIALIDGNYNGELLSIYSGNINKILAIPSIVTSDLSSNNLIDILNNNKLVYNGFENLPYSYSGSKYEIDANIDFSANDLLIFSGSISELKQSSNQVILLQNLYNAYSGSIIGNNLRVTKIDSIELFSPTPSTQIKAIACDIINFKLKFLTECDLHN